MDPRQSELQHPSEAHDRLVDFDLVSGCRGMGRQSSESPREGMGCRM